MRSSGILTRKDPDKDPEDSRRTDELETNFETKERKWNTSAPDTKGKFIGQIELVDDDDSTLRLYIKRKNGTWAYIDLTAL